LTSFFVLNLTRSLSQD